MLYDLTYVESKETSKFMETENRLAVARGRAFEWRSVVKWVKGAKGTKFKS